MNSIIKKLRKKLNNSGSSIVLVVVGLGFIGVLVGALLTAAGYALRQKVYNYNSKDNFFYLEQAMDEVYAGIGQETMDALKSAYDETVNEVVYYDLKTKSYEAKDNEQANKDFKGKFMKKVYTNPLFKDNASIKAYIESLISNDSVKLDKIPVIKVYDGDGNLYSNPAVVSGEVSKIVISNVVLKRTSNYSRSNTKASFTQTISTDIDISQPNFNVKFGTGSIDFSDVFGYALIAGNGVEIMEKLPQATDNKTFTVKGNVYAAADYYNKEYAFNKNLKFKYSYYKSSKNEANNEENNTTNTDDTGNINSEQKVNSVVNSNLLNYKGNTDRSKNSGIYIDGANTAFLSDMLVVPGSISVMNNGSVSIYSKQDNSVGKSRVWCDNFVLGGESLYNNTEGTYSGSSALIRGDLFVQDDLQLDANGSYFSMVGSYVGYNNSTLGNLRKYYGDYYTDENENKDFSIFKKVDGKYQYVDKSHINSSSISINGMKSTLKFDTLSNLYLAGRSYIEHSKRTIVSKVDGNDTKVYIYNSKMDDYKTGESIAVKSNQLAYIPTCFGNQIYMVDADHNGIYNEGEDWFVVSLQDPLFSSELILNHFPLISFGPNNKNNMNTLNISLRTFDRRVIPVNGKSDGIGEEVTNGNTVINNCVPIILKSINTSTDVTSQTSKNYIYYDFDRAWGLIDYHKDNAITKTAYEYCNNHKPKIKNADDLSDDFIVSYADALIAGQSDTATTTQKNLLVALTKIDDFDGYTGNTGDVVNVNAKNITNIQYTSSGALTENLPFDAGKKASFRIIDANNTYSLDGVLPNLNKNGTTTPLFAGKDEDASDIAKKVNTRYDYVKFSLKEILPDDPKAVFIDEYLQQTGAENAISPINTYFNFDELTGKTERVYDKVVLNGYVILATNDDEITLGDGIDGNPNDGMVRGIIFSSGKVKFASDVDKFEGLIVSGDKIVFPEDAKVLNVNSNAEMCKEIIKELQFSTDDDAKDLLKIFKGYESVIVEDPSQADESDKDIKYLDYSSVVKYSNWMKNVTDEYGK